MEQPLKDNCSQKVLVARKFIHYSQKKSLSMNSHFPAVFSLFFLSFFLYSKLLLFCDFGLQEFFGIQEIKSHLKNPSFKKFLPHAKNVSLHVHGLLRPAYPTDFSLHCDRWQVSIANYFLCPWTIFRLISFLQTFLWRIGHCAQWLATTSASSSQSQHFSRTFTSNSHAPFSLLHRRGCLAGAFHRNIPLLLRILLLPRGGQRPQSWRGVLFFSPIAGPSSNSSFVSQPRQERPRWHRHDVGLPGRRGRVRALLSHRQLPGSLLAATQSSWRLRRVPDVMQSSWRLQRSPELLWKPVQNRAALCETAVALCEGEVKKSTAVGWRCDRAIQVQLQVHAGEATITTVRPWCPRQRGRIHGGGGRAAIVPRAELQENRERRRQPRRHLQDSQSVQFELTKQLPGELTFL